MRSLTILTAVFALLITAMETNASDLSAYNQISTIANGPFTDVPLQATIALLPTANVTSLATAAIATAATKTKTKTKTTITTTATTATTASASASTKETNALKSMKNQSSTSSLGLTLPLLSAIKRRVSASFIGTTQSNLLNLFQRQARQQIRYSAELVYDAARGENITGGKFNIKIPLS